MLRFLCLFLLIAAVASGCGSSDQASDEREAAPPEYAATPRKSLESWVAAVRAGDIDMMCRLLFLDPAKPPTSSPVPTVRNGPRPCDQEVVRNRVLPGVRAEMRGLKGELRYGAIDIGAPEARIVIGVVSGDSPSAYAVPVARGKTQWSIDDEELNVDWPHPAPKAVLEQPDPTTPLPSGRTRISFIASAYRPGSNYPNAEVWIDGRHVDGRLDMAPAVPSEAIGTDADLERMRWIGTVRLLPSRHLMVAGVKGDGGVSANAWGLTVQ